MKAIGVHAELLDKLRPYRTVDGLIVSVESEADLSNLHLDHVNSRLIGKFVDRYRDKRVQIQPFRSINRNNNGLDFSLLLVVWYLFLHKNLTRGSKMCWSSWT